MIVEEKTRSARAPQKRTPLEVFLGGIAFLFSVAVALGLGWAIGRRIVEEEWQILVTLAGIGTYLVVALIDARHALLLWIVTAPFARFVHLDLDLGRGIPNITLNRIMTGVLLALLLAQLATRRRKMARPSAADVFLLAFCGAMILAVPQSTAGFTRAIQSMFDLIITPIGLYFLARNLIVSKRDLRGIMIALSIIGCYLGLLATHEQLTGDVWFYPEDRSVYYTASLRRVVGLLGNPAFIAVCIGMAIPWGWYLVLNTRRHRLLYLFAVLSGMSGIFFCMNRSGWVGLLVSMIVMALFVRRFRPIFIMMLMAAVVVAALYWAWLITSPIVRERLTAEGPLEYRREAWNVAWQMIRDHPLFGVGYENYRSLYRQYSRWSVYLRAEPSPHNTYLWVQVTAGLVSLVPFVAFLAAIVFPALGIYLRSRYDPLRAAEADLAGTFLASLAAILMPALVMDVLIGYYNNMVLFLIVGAFYGVMRGSGRELSSIQSGTTTIPLASAKEIPT